MLCCCAGVVAAGGMPRAACEGSSKSGDQNPWADSVKKWRAHVRAKVLGVPPSEAAAQEAVREKLATEHNESNAWIVFKSSPSTEGLVAPEKERFGRMVGQVGAAAYFS